MKDIVKTALKYTGYFAGIGFLYGASRSCLDNTITTELDPRPENFEMDRSAYLIFSELNKIRKISDKLNAIYLELFYATDRLFLLEKNLTNGTIPPRWDDQQLACSYLVSSKTYLEMMIKELRKHSQFKLIEEIKMIGNKWWKMMEIHCKTVGGFVDDHISIEELWHEYNKDQDEQD